jgi:hypothetical protein
MPSSFKIRIGSLCAYCLVTFLPESPTWRIGQVLNSRSRSRGDSPRLVVGLLCLSHGGDPHAYVNGGFVVTFWSCHEPVSGEDIGPVEYTEALQQLHAGLRRVDLPAPHFTDGVAEAQSLLRDPAFTPELKVADRELLASALRKLNGAIGQRGATEQLLHGEPHPGNLLRTKQGLLFIDLQTCCRGPVEFDIAHAPEQVSEHHADIDRDLVRQCRILVLAMVATWRWRWDDQLPNGRQMGAELLSQLRTRL